MILFNYKYNNFSLEYFYSIFSSVMKKIGFAGFQHGFAVIELKKKISVLSRNTVYLSDLLFLPSDLVFPLGYTRREIHGNLAGSKYFWMS